MCFDGIAWKFAFSFVMPFSFGTQKLIELFTVCWGNFYF